MNYTIKADSDLDRILAGATENQDQMVKEIINRLETANLLQEREDCGKQVKELAEMHRIDLVVLAAWIFKRGTKELGEMIGELTILGDEWNPCPECGCTLDVDTDEYDGYAWEDIKCSNPECDYTNNTEPDWDTMPGGHAYDQ